MSRVEKMITELTRQMFKDNEKSVGDTPRRQISLRPSSMVLCQIDTMADILDQSRQQLMDELLEGAMLDAVEAYALAHGPDHSEGARRSFVDAFKKRWDDNYSELQQ